MPQQDLYMKLSDQFQDAALDPRAWPDALCAVADHLGVDGCQCLAIEASTGHVAFGAVGRVDPAAQREYEEHYHAHDFRRPRYLAYAPLTAFTDRDISTPEERRHSPFHQEFLVRHDCGNVMLANFPLGESLTGVLALGRSLSKADYDDVARRRLEALLPAVRNAVRTRLEIDRLQVRAVALEAFLDTCDFGVFLLDRGGHMTYANAEALRLLAPGDCLRVKQARLTPVDPVASGHYGGMMFALQQTGLGAAGAGGVAMRLARANGLPGVDICLRPLRQTGWAVYGHGAEYALVAVDLAARPANLHTLLRTLYGFTDTEARCAGLLREGLSVDEIAATLDVARATVRVHLQSLFRKTDTSRQGELVAKLHRGIPGHPGRP